MWKEQCLPHGIVFCHGAVGYGRPLRQLRLWAYHSVEDGRGELWKPCLEDFLTGLKLWDAKEIAGRCQPISRTTKLLSGQWGDSRGSSSCTLRTRLSRNMELELRRIWETVLWRGAYRAQTHGRCLGCRVLESAVCTHVVEMEISLGRKIGGAVNVHAGASTLGQCGEACKREMKEKQERQKSCLQAR